MSYVRRLTVPVTTASDGTATEHSLQVTGRISQIRYVKGDFDNGVDFTITSEATGETIWTQADVNASVTVAPRQAVHSTAGVAATFDGTRPILAPIALAEDRVRIAIAQGGSVKSGTFYILVD